MKITAFDLAMRFVGVKEVPGGVDNPQIMAMLKLDGKWPEHDEVPWCSAFVNYIAWLLRLPRSKSLMARSWLQVGTPAHLADVRPGWDVVILMRGGEDQPGPDVLDAPGHVGFYASHGSSLVTVLGGNQSNGVSIARYDITRVLGIRRLHGKVPRVR